MAGFDEINKQINDRIQELSVLIRQRNYSQREYNELADLIYPKLRFFIWKFCKNDFDTEEAFGLSIEFQMTVKRRRKI